MPIIPKYRKTDSMENIKYIHNIEDNIANTDNIEYTDNTEIGILIHTGLKFHTGIPTREKIPPALNLVM